MIRCNKGYSKGGFTCESQYVSNESPSNNLASYSIQMNIGHQYCNACCKYCCCHPVPAKENLHKFFKADFPKMIQLIKDTDEKRKLVSPKHHFELWGGEPLLNFEALQETYAALKEAFPDAIFSTSSNGLVLKDDKVCDFLIANHFSLQLSHDGLGQRYRTGDVEPLDFDNTKALAQLNVINCINCTLSAINPSWYANIDFWNKWMSDSHIDSDKMYIKLNHPYDSDYDFKFAFVDDTTLLQYFSEFINLYWTCYYNPNALKPYRQYILDQGSRWHELRENESAGSCRAFQTYKHNLPGFKQDWNFVINTTGEYAECNLSFTVDNPGGVMPDYCKECKYSKQMECHHCGAMNYAEKPFYCKRWMEMLERIHMAKCFARHANEGKNNASKHA